jgi:hypothetical protein
VPTLTVKRLKGNESAGVHPLLNASLPTVFIACETGRSLSPGWLGKIRFYCSPDTWMPSSLLPASMMKYHSEVVYTKV